MSKTQQNFLHTTHRTVSWFRKTFDSDELEIAPPFQRNPVWTEPQKAYLIDTILKGLPIPELYMQDKVDEAGDESHIVVDGQQRIRACLEFVQGEFPLEENEEGALFPGALFDDLSPGIRRRVYSYKFVVRVLPDMSEPELREIFKRLNRNTVALNRQELRHATYWGPFIKSIESMADTDPYWADCGVFSANDHRRMLDREFISELATAYLHGPQNKKDKLERYYQIYEKEFEQRDDMEHDFRSATGELQQLMPDLNRTRWRKKSDFYTLFLVIVGRVAELPLARDQREHVRQRLLNFGREIDRLVSIEDDERAERIPLALKYARAVRASTDKGARVSRHEALDGCLFDE